MTPNKSKLEVRSTGELKVKNFHCSQHGYVKPFPQCPLPHTNTEPTMEDCQKCISYICKCEVKEFTPTVDKDWQVEERKAFVKWYHQEEREDRSDQTIADYFIERIRIAREKVAHFYKVTKTGKLGRQDMEKAFQAGRQQGQKKLIKKIKKIPVLNSKRASMRDDIINLITKYEIEI